MLCFCKNTMDKIVINKNEYYYCNKCGYLKKIAVLPESLQKERYDNHVCDDGYLFYMEGVFNKIRKYLRAGKSIDYGCGKIHALANILNLNKLDCDYYDLFYYNKPITNTYDNIILIEVFEHITDIYEFLLELKKILNSKGRIIIMTNPIPDKLENWWYLRDGTHVSFVSFKTMRMLAEMLDFNLIIDKENKIFILEKNN